jgi:glycosyltransferase involved in cell wall biosynthesis
VSRRPRLLVATDTLAGGMGYLAMAQAAWFRERGWHVKIAVPDGHEIGEDQPPVGDVLESVSIPETARDLKGIVRSVRETRSLVRTWKPDIIHCHGARAFGILRFATARRSFVTLHGTGSVPSDPPGWTFVRRLSVRLLPWLAVEAFSVAPGLGGRWTFLPHASPRLKEMGEIAFPDAASVPTFVWLGALDERKQPQIFIEAIAALPAGTRVRAVIAGRGSLVDEIRELAARLRVDIELVGHQSDVAALLAEAWAVVLFSRYEGVPFALEEAMWAGRPVIATPHPGVVWLLGGTGRLAETPPEVAAAIQAFSDHDAALQEGRRAEERVREAIDPDAPWPMLEAAYRRAMS